MTPLTIALRRLPDAARAEQCGILSVRAQRTPRPPDDAYLADRFWDGWVLEECRRMAEARLTIAPTVVPRCSGCGAVIAQAVTLWCGECSRAAWARAG